jgi:crotonobetainyl-CoA:carnitine CoA-transferase CaiB-like acyl-CoA transferase
VPRAFEGIRVIDFTQVLAGPFAAQQLALLGADVIKIEQPGTGDQTRGLMAADSDQPGMAPSFLTCNLGKRSVTLNLKAPEAREIVHALVRSADVVIENFKPGVIQRLGFGFDALAPLKPDLVYCSISGYGQEGPKAALAAYDGAIQAASGMMSITGHPETGPVRTGYMPVDMATALHASFAIAAALYRRRVTGEGQYVDVAMMDTAVAVQAPQMANYLVNGVLPELFGNRSPTKQPTANVFQTADGHIQVVALKEPQVRALFEVLGCSASYATPAFKNAETRVANTTDVARVLREAFVTNTTAYWNERLVAADVPVAEIRDLAAVAADTQFAHRSVFAKIPRPGRPNETVSVVATGHTTNVDPPVAVCPAPQLGEHTDSVLAELGYSAARIADLRARGVI